MTSFFSASNIWILPYASVVFYWAYKCSRGDSGDFLWAIIGYGILSIFYYFMIQCKKSISTRLSIFHLVVLEAFTITALAIDPQLDEMGGIINYLLPLLVAILVIVNWSIKHFINIKKQ